MQQVNFRVKAKLNILLEERLESYYWMGFLTADGYFSKENRLALRLSQKDQKHLINFCSYISCNNYKNFNYNNYQSCSISIQDNYTIPKIKTKFDLKLCKTYNPPENLTWLTGDKLIAFFIGFIDGDGCIGFQYGRNDCILRIKIHSSWLNILNYIVSSICKIINTKNPKAKINNSGYAEISISNSLILKFLKNKTKELCLPVLSRKWDKIKENNINKNEIAKIRKDTVLTAFNKGMTRKEISSKFNLTYGCVNRIIWLGAKYRKERFDE